MMKKALILSAVLLLLLACVCHADTTDEKTAFMDSCLVLVRVETDGTFSYGLLGPGAGTEFFALLGSDGGDEYSSLFAKAQSAIADYFQTHQFAYGIDPLVFSWNGDSGAIEVELTDGGGPFAKLATGFAVLTGSFADSQLVFDEGAYDMFIWRESGAVQCSAVSSRGVDADICANCGKIDDGSDIHTEVFSELCTQGHTLCMGEQDHQCDSCGKTYTCTDAAKHARCRVCGEAWCYRDEGKHTSASCGHRECAVYRAPDEHERCWWCDEYLCGSADHSECSRGF